MRNGFFRILLVGLVLFCLIGAVSASENMTENQLMDGDNLEDVDDSLSISDSEVVDDFDGDDSLSVSDFQLVKDDEKHMDMYVNCSKEENGDGLSPETAFNYTGLYFWEYPDYNGFPDLANNGTIHLAEGSYELLGSSPDIKDNSCINVLGQDGTVITKFSYQGQRYTNPNRTVTFINIIFDIHSTSGVGNTIYSINLGSDVGDYNFINCTFINTSFVMSSYEHNEPNRGGITDVCTAIFENCKFLNYAYDPSVHKSPIYVYDDKTEDFVIFGYVDYFHTNPMFTNYECGKFVFNNCLFDNISCDAIVDSYGGNSDNYGRVDGVYIYNSTFTNCEINGVVKALQIGFCKISNCTYDFPVSTDTPLTNPFYIDSTDVPILNTSFDLVANGTSLIITLTDESNKPLVDVEVEIIANGNVSYGYTDNDGRIVINNLLGDYSFEISYPGDEYEGFAPCKVMKNLTFTEPKSSTVLIASKVSATYNVAKNLVVTLKDINGKLLANKKVTVKLGSISKTLKTNSKGQVSVNVATLVPKTYTATVKFAGDSSYKASTVKPKVVVNKAKPKLAAKAKTFKVKAKVKKYTATLKNNKGKVLKKVKLTLKVGKKTYTAKTNAKGVATFKVKLTKKGKNTATVKFAGNKYFTAISKKVKITVK